MEERKRKRREERLEKARLQREFQKSLDQRNGITEADRSIWFYNDKNGAKHMCELLDLPDKMRKGIIDSNTYVYSKSNALNTKKMNVRDWTRIREYPELCAYIQDKIFEKDVAELDMIAGVPNNGLDDFQGTQHNSTSHAISANPDEILKKLGDVRNYFIRAYDSGVVEPKVDLQKLNRTLTQIESFFPDAKSFPKGMETSQQRLTSSLQNLYNCSHAVAQEIISMCEYLIGKGEGFDNPSVTNAYRGRVSELSEECNIQLKRTNIVFREIAFKEQDLDFVDPGIYKGKGDDDDTEEIMSKEKERIREEAKKDLKERRLLAESGKIDEKFDKKAKAQAEKRKYLEEFLLKLPAMTLYQSRRLLASILGYHVKYFDRYPKDSLENFVKSELDDKLSVEKMKNMLINYGLPMSFLYGKSKLELSNLCMAYGIDAEA